MPDNKPSLAAAVRPYQAAVDKARTELAEEKANRKLEKKTMEELHAVAISDMQAQIDELKKELLKKTSTHELDSAKKNLATALENNVFLSDQLEIQKGRTRDQERRASGLQTKLTAADAKKAEQEAKIEELEKKVPAPRISRADGPPRMRRSRRS